MGLEKAEYQSPFGREINSQKSYKIREKIFNFFDGHQYCRWHRRTTRPSAPECAKSQTNHQARQAGLGGSGR